MQKTQGIYKLTRINVIAESIIPLLLLSVFMVDFDITFEFLIMALAMLLTFIFTFMINDIEDAQDDARDPKKKLRNPVSAGIISKTDGYIASAIVVIITLLLLVILKDILIIMLGITTLIIGFLYSWKIFRLKSMPIVDVLSHAFFLGSVQLLMFGLLQNDGMDFRNWLIVIGVFVFSIGGDLHNEIRDWKVDQAAGLKNTANLIGLSSSRMVRLGSWIVGSQMVVAGVVLILVEISS